MAIAIQAGTYFAARRGPRLRAFWGGFVIAGTAAALDLAADSLKLIRNPPAIAGLWRAYFYRVESLIVRSPGLRTHLTEHRGSHQVASWLIYFVPQLTAALAGGVLAFGLGALLLRRCATPTPLPLAHPIHSSPRR